MQAFTSGAADAFNHRVIVAKAEYVSSKVYAHLLEDGPHGEPYLTYESWMQMTEEQARPAILDDYGIPVEIFDRFPSLLNCCGSRIEVLLDHHGSYRRWAHSQGYSAPEVQFGCGKSGSLLRRFYVEVIWPLKKRSLEIRGIELGPEAWWLQQIAGFHSQYCSLLQ
ncbi:MAG: hypothetical protein ACRD7E_05605 [Bryobacteraceae bacterium]